MKNKRETRGLMPGIRIAMALLVMAFVAGAVIYARPALEDWQGDRANEQLQLRVREREFQASVGVGAVPVAVSGAAADLAHSSSMDFAPLTELNSDIVAWLCAEGTAIDYPVLHTDDNAYYLTRLYTGESNRNGSLFADYRNSGLFTEQNTVIYGHNMRSGAMFHSLGEYKAQDYYDAVPTMTLYTPEGDYIVELFSGTIENGNYEFVEFDFVSGEAFLAYVDGFRARSTFQSDVDIGPTDRIVSLCTCSYEQNNARYMLMGKLTPLG